MGWFRSPLRHRDRLVAGAALRRSRGSNPLLELVLESRDPLALSLLAMTAVVLAPLFEEVIFRGRCCRCWPVEPVR
ncbi:MAG: hypothetical protein CM15mP77_3080 [Synechococcus sp.]|nr:MAG: hypothetical protein CM15mP77_3080 [Synechococcus sp.]